MLNPSTFRTLRWPASQPPLLVVVVDTESEFDWSQQQRRSTAVKSVGQQALAQAIFSRFGVRPTYVLDYPVSSTPEGYAPIREFLAADACEIGAHLQPWDTPPIVEEATERNSFPGNLPPELERSKLARLTETIEANLGRRPRIYKAGRYGVGHQTAALLAELGYEIDTSVLPGTDLSHMHGPDFSECGAEPYWFGDAPRLLELPLTIGFVGLLAPFSRYIRRVTTQPLLAASHFPGVLARLRLFERITLTPEGITFEEQRRLTEALLGRGQRIFNFAYHSPSLMPGNTPYVRNEQDLRRFLDTIERYLDYFMGKVGGQAATPLEIKSIAERSTAL